MLRNPALFTDLYELTMAQAYIEEGMTKEAVFSLFVRRLPERRNFLLACGLDSVLDCLEHLRFTEDDLAYLQGLNRFSSRFLCYLRNFRFTGSVYAVPEGTPVFANEPILEIVAPLPEAQIIETFVMNQIHVQTVLGTKAYRMVTAAAGRPVIDFAPRRMHGVEAAVIGARAFYIAGVAATSNVLAGKIYNIPVTGTMAHSYIQAHDNEMDAFLRYSRLYPETVLLVDTYDTLQAVDKVIELADILGEDFRISGIRIDSGDLSLLSARAREMLDQAGLGHVKIFVSGGLDEDKIARLIATGAPIDGFGVGTHMGVSEDAPALDIAYKLSEYAGVGRVKLSPGKAILPGRKQVFRIKENGTAIRDVIARSDEPLAGTPLLKPVMRDGKRLAAGRADVEAIRGHAQRQIAALPDHIRNLAPASAPYPVEISAGLSRYQETIQHRMAGAGSGR